MAAVIPKMTAWPIAPRLTGQERRGGHNHQAPRTYLYGIAKWRNCRFFQDLESFVYRLPRTDKWRYHRRTVMLIDERTPSQAENTGLFFRSGQWHKVYWKRNARSEWRCDEPRSAGKYRRPFQRSKYFACRRTATPARGPEAGCCRKYSSTLAGIRMGRDEVLGAAIDYLDYYTRIAASVSADFRADGGDAEVILARSANAKSP